MAYEYALNYKGGRDRLTILVTKNQILRGLSKLIVDLLHACGDVELKVIQTSFDLLCSLKDLDVLNWQGITSFLPAIAEAEIMTRLLVKRTASCLVTLKVGCQVKITIEANDVLLFVTLGIGLLGLLKLLVRIRVSIDLYRNWLYAYLGWNLLQKEMSIKYRFN